MTTSYLYSLRYNSTNQLPEIIEYSYVYILQMYPIIL